MFSIWQHLVTLTETEKITVIITTHYIEEARQANVVGLMRHGRLLAEAAPENLLAQYNMETLEEVFLKLCLNDSSAKANALASSANTSSTNLALGPVPISTSSEISVKREHKIEDNLKNSNDLTKAGQLNVIKVKNRFTK